MKRILCILLVLPLLLICAIPLMAEEEAKVPETGLKYLPETTDLNILSTNMATAIRINPISLPAYVGTQVDFWGEVLKRFLKTAKPMVLFKDKTSLGLEITIYEQPSFCVTWGKVYQIEGGEIGDQPSFIAIEAKDFPLLSDLSTIFKRIRPQIAYVDNRFWFGLAYELMEE